MKFFKLSVFGAFMMFTTSAYAADCDRRDVDKAEYFSEKFAEQIVDKNGGGQDVVVNIKDCDYNTYSKLFKVAIEIYWNGSFDSSNRYNMDGQLKMDNDGNYKDFAVTYKNQALKDYEFWTGAAAITVLGVMALSESSTQ